MNCPVCNFTNAIAFSKNGVDYHVCELCDTCYSIALPNAGMIGGIAETERTLDNEERIRRFRLYGCKTLFDYGCGHGYLVDDAIKYNLEAWGYDKYNPQFQVLPPIQVDVISMIEVIEHMIAPFDELGVIWRALKPGGHVYIETSFTDIGHELGNLQDFFYIAPDAGHSTIFSHKSLDMLMISRGFTPKEPINSTVRIYQK